MKNRILKLFVESKISQKVYDFPTANRTVSGLNVSEDIPNLSSIESTLNDFEILKGVKEVPINLFDFSFKSNFYDKKDFNRVQSLKTKIKENGYIKPLIVVIDDEGPYILEGGHRLVALGMLNVKSFPAIVVIDKENNEINESSEKLIGPVYHGTPAKFDEFDPSFIGSRFGKDKKGFFFTADPTNVLGGAGDYAGEKGEIKKAYLKIENPITLQQYAKSLNTSVEDIMHYDGDEIPAITIWDEDKEDIMKLNPNADGIILSDPSLHKYNALYVVFDKNQIFPIKG